MPLNEIDYGGSLIPGTSRYSYRGNSSTTLGRLKDVYLEAWEDYVHVGPGIEKHIMTKRGEIGGIRAITSIVQNYPQGVGIALFEGDDAPTPRSVRPFNPEIIERFLHARFRWTWQVQAAARMGNRAAWKDPRMEDLATGRKQFQINIRRMLYMGPYQQLATQNGAIAVNTSTVFDRNLRNSQNDNRAYHSVHFLRELMSISHVAASAGVVQHGGSPANADVTEATGVYANERYINAEPSSSALTFTVNTAWDVNPANESIIIPMRSRRITVGADGANTDSNFAGINGIGNLIASSGEKQYVYGLDRTTYSKLTGQVLTNGSGGAIAWKEEYIIQAVDQIADNGIGEDPDMMNCHRSVRREYVKETKGDRRFEPVLTRKGFGARLAFDAGDVSVPLYTDRDCPTACMYILDSSSFGWFSGEELHTFGGGERFVVNKVATEELLVKSGNLACRKTFNNARREDILANTDGLTDTA